MSSRPAARLGRPGPGGTGSSRWRAAAAPGAVGARAQAVVEWALIGGGFLALFFLLPHGLFGDDNRRFGALEAWVHAGRLSRGPYSLLMPLISLPVLALGKLVESRSWWAGRFNVIVVAVGVAVVFRLLRGRVDPRLLRLTVLVLLFASFLTNRLRDYNAEVLTATLVTLGIICLATGRHVTSGWGAIVVGVASTPAAFAGLLLLVALQTLRTRRLRTLAPLAAAAALIMAENWLRRGGPLVTGYEGNHGFRTLMPYSGLPGFSYPFLLGLASILLSFGRGLLFFTPGLALWLDRRTRRLVPGRHAAVLMVAFTAGLVLVYSKWWAWYGGLGWGPRFFAFAAVPASLFLAVRVARAGASARADALTLAVLVLSTWVAISGATADLGSLSFCTSDGVNATEQLCWFTPDYSSLWQPVREGRLLSDSSRPIALYCLLVFAYLALPLAAGLLRAARPRRAWLAGWRV